MVRVRFEDLPTSDLIVGAIYQSGHKGQLAGEPISKLLSVGNMGGFRFMGRPMPEGCRLVGLFKTHSQHDWPDHFDPETGIFTYYGDNRTPDADLHDTSSGGNTLLRYIFDSIRSTPSRRADVPPVFVFEQVPDSARDVRFLGLAAPGTPPDLVVKDLEEVTHGSREASVTNYRAKFTVLDAPVVSRKWIESLQAGKPDIGLAPEAWSAWVEEGVYRVRDEVSDPSKAISTSVRFMIPTAGPDGWRALLRSPISIGRPVDQLGPWLTPGRRRMGGHMKSRWL